MKGMLWYGTISAISLRRNGEAARRPPRRPFCRAADTDTINTNRPHHDAGGPNSSSLSALDIDATEPPSDCSIFYFTRDGQE